MTQKITMALLSEYSGQSRQYILWLSKQENPPFDLEMVLNTRGRKTPIVLLTVKTSQWINESLKKREIK